MENKCVHLTLNYEHNQSKVQICLLDVFKYEVQVMLGLKAMTTWVMRMLLEF